MFWRRGTDEDFDVTSDVELINKLVDGNRAALNAFYSRYSKLIYYTIQHVEKDLTDDIFQEFFMRLQDTQYRALQLWNRSRPLPNFLRQVVRNFALDKLRKERPHRVQNGSDVLENLDVASEEVSVQEAIEMRQLRKGAVKAWAQLASNSRSPTDLRKISSGYGFRCRCGARGTESGRFPQGAFRRAATLHGLVKLSIPEYFL